jgi:hypothetical protein
MRFTRSASLRIIVVCSAALLAVSGPGIVPRKLAAAEPADEIARLFKADDFWARTGASQTHETITPQDSDAVRQLAGTADSSVVRIRAFKVLADLYGRTRYSSDIPQPQSLEAVEGVFYHLERHANDAVVSKFRPELGFTHVSLSQRSDDPSSLWVLIESTDGVLPSGGLNIRWNPTSKSVDRIEHWGANRKPSP